MIAVKAMRWNVVVAAKDVERAFRDDPPVVGKTKGERVATRESAEKR